MAIDQYLAQIRSARYGEEVRGAIADAIEENYTDVTTSTTLADAAADRADEAAAGAEGFPSVISESYSPPYSYGDYLYVGGALRKATQDISAEEDPEFVPSHWSGPLTIVEEFSHCSETLISGEDYEITISSGGGN